MTTTTLASVPLPEALALISEKLALLDDESREGVLHAIDVLLAVANSEQGAATMLADIEGTTEAVMICVGNPLLFTSLLFSGGVLAQESAVARDGARH
jgi:hypothetical protein